MTAQPSYTLFDGAMATELVERGFNLSEAKASAIALRECPKLVQAIHRDYLDAGAQILRCNSFALHQVWIDNTVDPQEILRLCDHSVQLAKMACAEYFSDRGALRVVQVAASLAPPRPTTTQAQTHSQVKKVNFYAPIARQMLQSGCDALLIETVTSIDLAIEALQACLPICREFARPLWLSMVVGPNGDLLGSGSFEDLCSILQREYNIDALFINCSDIQHLPDALRTLDQASQNQTELPLGVLPHLSAQHGDHWQRCAYTPEVFARKMAILARDYPRLRWWGACCGSTPAHIAALHQLFLSS